MTIYIALIGWPLVVVILFRRLSLPVALIWSVVAGFLLLPPKVGIDLPLLPNIDKDFIPSATAALVAMVMLRQKQGRLRSATGPDPAMLPGWLPRSNVVRVLTLILIAGAFATAAQNGDALNYGGRYLRGLRSYDAFSITLNALVGLLPLFLARKFLAHPDNHRTLLVILCIAGLLYTLPTIYEARMSPRLNTMLYGFFAADWRQHIRNGGFRPLVFLNHGLVLGMFLASTVLAALAVFRAGGHNRRWLFLAAAFWLLIALFLSKNLGALLVAVVLIPVVLLFGVRLQLLAAAVIAVMVLSFPVLRSTDFIPVSQLANLAVSINPARARSFQFRLDNEDQLLSKALERPGFGWGSWGRARVFDDRGRDISTTDGYWVITIGEGGWTRYISEFGMLTLPIILLAWRRRRYDITLATSGLALVLAGNLVDLIPNAGLTPITWLMAGALLGRLELQKIETAAETGAEIGVTGPKPTRTPRYSRQHPGSHPGSGQLTYARQSRAPQTTGVNTGPDI